MADDSSILNASTISAFMEALNEQYQLNLPTSFEEGTTFSEIWQMAVQVTQSTEPDLLYQAITNIAFNFAPGLDGKVFINVLNADEK